MSDWQTVITIIVRNLVNDTDSSTYTNARIQSATAVAGLIVAQEVDLDNDYTFDLSTPDITPDPVVVNDTVAVALFALKAACILSMNSYQSAVGKGIRVRDGDSEVDTTGSFKGYSDIIAIGPCGAYAKLVRQVELNQGFGKGKAIFSPVSLEVNGPDGVWHTRGLYDSLGW